MCEVVKDVESNIYIARKSFWKVTTLQLIIAMSNNLVLLL